MLRGIYLKWVIVFVVMFTSLHCFAQQYHFVYLQADNQQPFYVKYNGKNYSSSSIGYLILPKLSDGSFSVQIGFPKNLYPEQTFNLSVAGRDLGYALKNFDAKGWGLFNFQTTDIVMNVNTSAASETTATQTTTNSSNPFGNMLADAINDSTLNRQNVVIAKDSSSKKIIDSSLAYLKDSLHNANSKQPIEDSIKSSSTASPVVSQTTAPHTDNLAANNSINKDTSLQNKTTIGAAGSIIKSSESTSNGGTDLTFLDNTSKDTIHAFIPSTDAVKAVVKDTMSVEAKASLTDSAKGKIDNPFFSNNNNNNTSTSQPVMLDTTNSTPGTKSSVITNSNCQKMFSSYDADKLKKKIVSLHNQDDILAAIKKSLRDKCVTTEQLKDLGNLFLSDEDRFGLYEAVYPSVSDYFNLPQLQSTLIDTSYKNRFKALLH